MPLDLSYIDRADTNGAFVAPAPRRGIHPVLKYGPVGSNLLDALTTMIAMKQNPQAMEGNPFMRGIADDPALLFGVKGLIGLLTGLGADKLHKDGHETLGNIVGGISFGAPLLAAGNNARHFK